MIEYVSFLRGINVGGHKLIKMEDLKKYFQSMNLKDVLTFIQSGNVVFKSTEKNLKKLNERIKKNLAEQLGYEVEIITKSKSDIKKILDKVPFKDIVPDKFNKIYISFLSVEPEEKNKIHLEKLSYEAEEFVSAGTEAYILVRKNKIKDKQIFTTNFIEKKLGVNATTRDWNTINKITLL